MTKSHATDDRGRGADKPTDIPAKGWKDALVRVKKEIKDDNVGLLAAGVAFYAFLSLVPALIALVSLYGLVAEPAQVQRQLAQLQDVLPSSAYDLVRQQLRSIVSSAESGLTLGFAASLAAALWSASSGMKGLISGITMSYDESETRGFLKLRGLALLLTLGAIVGVVIALAAIVVVPLVLDTLGLGRFGQLLVSIGRWPVLGAMIVVGLAVVYRYAPDRDKPQWRWVSPGAVVATVLWLIGSILFSVYVNNFGSYDATYGALAAVIVMLLWLFLTSFIVLFGAQLDSELEHQTKVDTTAGPDQPMGRRDAVMADTLGESQGR